MRAEARLVMLRKRAKELGMTGVSKSGLMQHVLGDRIGHHGGGVPGRDRRDGLLDGRDGRCSIGRIGTAGLCLTRSGIGITGRRSANTGVASPGVETF